MPHIIAGENMDIPVLGSLLKSVGAVYIRREWGNDSMYKTVLEEYISVLLSRGSKYHRTCNAVQRDVLIFPTFFFLCSELSMFRRRHTVSIG